VFLSGRDEKTVEAEDTGFHPLFKYFKTRIDREARSVTVSFLIPGLFRKKAVYLDKLGSVLLNDVSEKDVRAWKPVIPDPEPAKPEAVPWPDGELLPGDPPPANIDMSALGAALDKVFAEPDPKNLRRTRAVVVVQDGRLAAERYAPGFTKDTPLISWSVGKSITSALVGILVGQGKWGVMEPAPIAEWQGADDPRKAITIDDLLHMSSGLEWYEAYADHPVSDVNRMLFLKGDMAAYAAGRKLVAKPGTKWEYSTGSAMLLNRIIREAVGNREEYWAFPRNALFNRIGMRGAVMEPDAVGTFSGGSYIYATARDFARFGLLYLQDGVWNGERILPEGWVHYTTTPAAAADKLRDYGAQFWLNAGNVQDETKRMLPKLPTDAFFCDGYQGQLIAIIPSAKLVIVRLGMTWEGDWGTEEFLAGILAAVR